MQEHTHKKDRVNSYLFSWFYLPVKVSQFAIRRVVPSLLRMIGPHSSNRIDSPSLMDGRLESGSGAGSLGIFPFSLDAENASAFSVDPAIVIAVRNTIALASRMHRRMLNNSTFTVSVKVWMSTVQKKMISDFSTEKCFCSLTAYCRRATDERLKENYDDQSLVE